MCNCRISRSIIATTYSSSSNSSGYRLRSLCSMEINRCGCWPQDMKSLTFVLFVFFSFCPGEAFRLFGRSRISQVCSLRYITEIWHSSKSWKQLQEFCWQFGEYAWLLWRTELLDAHEIASRSRLRCSFKLGEFSRDELQDCERNLEDYLPSDYYLFLLPEGIAVMGIQNKHW